MIIGANSAPALGDLRSIGSGTKVWLRSDARQRKDWPRYLDALASAIAHGADVVWIPTQPLTLEEQARSDWAERTTP